LRTRGAKYTSDTLLKCFALAKKDYCFVKGHKKVAKTIVKNIVERNRMKEAIFYLSYLICFGYGSVCSMERLTIDELGIEIIKEVIKNVLNKQRGTVQNQVAVGYILDAKEKEIFAKYFTKQSLMNVIAFCNLNKKKCFTLPNLCIEQLLTDLPSSGFTLPAEPADDPVLKSYQNAAAANKILLTFYQDIAPIFCNILNSKYIFSENFKSNLPITYASITKESSPDGGCKVDLESKSQLSKEAVMQNIDKILAAAYMKEARG
jgi:hypothetical protein